MADVEAAATASDAPAPAPRPPLKRSPRAAAFVNITEGDNQRSNKEKDPSFLFNLAVTRRRPVCFCLFLTNLSFIVLTVALGLAGLNPINTNNIGEVGLILPDETYQPVWKSTSVSGARQFFTKSFLGNDAAVLASSSGEEPASSRHRAGVASMAWRTTR